MRMRHECESDSYLDEFKVYEELETSVAKQKEPPGLKHKKIVRRYKDSGSVLKELKKMNKTILTLAERMRKAEKRMRKMDCKIKGSIATSFNSSSNSKKKIVPNGVRVSSCIHSPVS